MTLNNAINASISENFIVIGAASGYTGISPTSNSGYILTSNGLSSPPTFTTPGYTSGITYISKQTASSSSEITFTGLSNTYYTYLLIFDNVITASSTVTLDLNVSTNNGSTYDTTNNLVGTNFSAVNSNSFTNTTSTSAITLIPSTDNPNPSFGFFSLFNVGTSASFNIIGQSSFYSASLAASSFSNTGGMVNTTGVNAIKITASSGNITSGVFYLYGIIY